MNYVSLMGRLTKDPELKKTSTGKSYCRFSVAIKREFSKDGGTDFVNCVAWDKRAEVIVSYFSKGHRILIQGRINTGVYEVNGEKRSTFDVIVDKLDFIESNQPNNYDNKSHYSMDVPQMDEEIEEDIDFPF